MSDGGGLVCAFLLESSRSGSLVVLVLCRHLIIVGVDQLLLLLVIRCRFDERTKTMLPALARRVSIL